MTPSTDRSVPYKPDFHYDIASAMSSIFGRKMNDKLQHKGSCMKLCDSFYHHDLRCFKTAILPSGSSSNKTCLLINTPVLLPRDQGF